MKYIPPPKDAPVLERYEEIRTRYQTRSRPTSQGGVSLTDAHGFFQTGSVLTQRWAGLDKLFHTLIMGVVDDPDYALKKDPKVYGRMLRDPQIYYCLEVRKAATRELSWHIAPPAGYENEPMAVRLAEAADRRLRRIPRFTELLDNLLDALLPGISVVELVWDVDDAGQYVVKKHYPVNKDRVVFDKYGKPRLKSRKAPIKGEEFPPYKFITHRFCIADGSWRKPETAGYVYYGRGLADTPLYHYFYFKVATLRFLLKALERYGHPLKVLYTGPQDARLAAKAAEIMAALQNDSEVLIPGSKREGTEVEMLRGSFSGDLFIKFLEYIDKLIMRTILGQELMTEMPATAGSYAAAYVHASVFARIAEGDRNLLQDTLNNTLMRYDAALNTPNIKPELYPVFRFRRSVFADAPNFLQVAQGAIQLGIPVSVSQVRELTGLKEPRDPEDNLTLQLQQQQQQQQEQEQEQEQEQAAEEVQ